MNDQLSPMTGSIARPRSGFITDAKSYRRYASTVTTFTTMNMQADSANHRILYEVGRRHATAVAALKAHADDVVLVDAAYPSGGVLSTELSGLSKKYSNFSGSFEYSNLAGVVERLAKGLAAYSVFGGTVTAASLAGGEPVRIHALATYDGPVSACVDTVFIPRVADSILRPDVFAAIAHAVAGEGGTVATDMVEINATTREPIIREVSGSLLPRAIVEALRIMGATMAAADQGELFALALTRGIHAVVSVVGHTDEGGIIRDVLRRGGFTVPFGGVHLAGFEYCGLPALSSTSPESVAGYVDALALKTAGLVAHCDPGVVYNGEWLPTFISGTTTADPLAREGTALTGTATHAANIQAQLALECGTFAAAYCRALAKLLGLASGGPTTAALHLRASFGLLPVDSRHLQFASVAPFYWVEPTSLVPHDFLGSAAEREGFAAYATAGQRRELPAWESINVLPSSGPHQSEVAVRFRGPRATPIIAHLLNHNQNGLGCVVPLQFDSTGIIHPGRFDAEPRVSDRLDEGRPITDYMWRRGQSPFPAPGELINLSGAMVFKLVHQGRDDDGFVTVEHLPAYHEIAESAVTFMVSLPAGISSGVLGEVDSHAQRARTRASRALAGANLRALNAGRTIVTEARIAHVAPNHLLAPPRHVIGPAAGDRPPGVDYVGASSLKAGAESAPPTHPTVKAAPTVPAVAVVHQDPTRGPAPATSAATRGGGAPTPRPAGATAAAPDQLTAAPAPPTPALGAETAPVAAGDAQ